MVPKTRREFIDHCLRKLGHPVIKIDVSKEQIDDRVDEALHFFRDYHYAGTRHMYYKHEITEADVDAGWVQMPEEMINVVRVAALSQASLTGSGMFSVDYQYMLNSVKDFSSFKVSDYYSTMAPLSLIQEWVIGKTLIDFNRYERKIYIRDGKTRFRAGTFLIVEAYERYDRDDFASDIWSDKWLQNYAAILIKENWGNNMSKFQNVQLMGGVMFNAEKILSDAVEERRKIEEQVTIDFPCINGFIG